LSLSSSSFSPHASFILLYLFLIFLLSYLSCL
jgi:hypothetical protein